MVSHRLISCIRLSIVAITVTALSTLYLLNQQQQLLVEADKVVAKLQNISTLLYNVSLFQNKLKFDANETRFYVRAYGKQTEILERLMRKNNLLLYGVPYQDEGVDLEATVIDIFNKELGINLTKGDLEIAKRVSGQEDDNDVEPIFIRFSLIKDKASVFYKRKSLPNYLSLEEDLTPLQKRELKKLQKIASEEKQKGRKIRWSGKKLFVDNILVDITKLNIT